MKIESGQFHIDLIPETQYEVDQLDRLGWGERRVRFDLVQRPGDPRYPASLEVGNRLRVGLPKDAWGS